MATPTTLVELAQQRHAAWTAARAAAQTSAAQAQTDLNAASQALAGAAAKFAEEERKAADIRAQLATITTPADGEPLLDQLEQTIVEQHAAAAAILAAEAGVARAQAAL